MQAERHRRVAKELARVKVVRGAWRTHGQAPRYAAFQVCRESVGGDNEIEFHGGPVGSSQRRRDNAEQHRRQGYSSFTSAMPAGVRRGRQLPHAAALRSGEAPRVREQEAAFRAYDIADDAFANAVAKDRRRDQAEWGGHHQELVATVLAQIGRRREGGNGTEAMKGMQRVCKGYAKGSRRVGGEYD